MYSTQNPDFQFPISKLQIAISKLQIAIDSTEDDGEDESTYCDFD
jgi:hypothetical protein